MLPENNILLEDHSWRRFVAREGRLSHMELPPSMLEPGHTSDVMNRLAIEHCDHCLPRCKTETEYPDHRHLRNMLRNRAIERR